MIVKEFTENKCFGYDESKLTTEEIEFARYYFIKGWNAMLRVLPNVLDEKCLLSPTDAERIYRDRGCEYEYTGDPFTRIPFNREYTEDKKTTSFLFQ